MLRLVGKEFADRLRIRANPGAVHREDIALSLIVVELREIRRTLARMTQGLPATEAGREPPALGGAGAVSFDEAVARWKDDLTARDCTRRSVERMVSIVARVAECSGWTGAGDVTYQAVVAFLAARRRQKTPWSNATHDQAVSTLRTFGEFLRRSGVLLVNPLTDLQSVGCLNPQGSRALTVEQARSLVAHSIDRHLESRRAKGCAPLFWTVLFLTGLRVSEAGSMQWSDLDLDSEHPCIWTDPRWEGNKAGRRDRIPLHPQLHDLLTKMRSSRMYRAGAVFPMVPTTSTWNMDREAAGIPERDSRKRKATRHSTRKSFCTWCDSLNIPRGVVSRLARHATTLTEKTYIDHGEEAENAAIAQLGGVWPEKVEIFSIRAARIVGQTENSRYIASATLEKRMNPTTSQRILAGRPGNPGHSGSNVAVCPQGPGRSAVLRSSRDSSPVTPLSRSSRKEANGQVRSLSDRENPRDLAVRALAHYLLNDDTEAAPHEESADDRVNKAV